MAQIEHDPETEPTIMRMTTTGDLSDMPSLFNRAAASSVMS
jgi:hypothetical protein